MSGIGAWYRQFNNEYEYEYFNEVSAPIPILVSVSVHPYCAVSVSLLHISRTHFANICNRYIHHVSDLNYTEIRHGCPRFKTFHKIGKPRLAQLN